MWKGTQFRRILQRKLYYLFHGGNIDAYRVELYEMNESTHQPQTLRSTQICGV